MHRRHNANKNVYAKERRGNRNETEILNQKPSHTYTASDFTFNIHQVRDPSGVRTGLQLGTLTCVVQASTEKL